MKRIGSYLALAALPLIAVGCQTTHSSQTAGQPAEESISKVELMDKGVQTSVAVVGMDETTLPDGRLQIAANVRNRENRRIQVQANCEFKDAKGFAIDSTPWKNVILTENAQETLHFASANDQAKRFTIRIREAR